MRNVLVVFCCIMVIALIGYMGFTLKRKFNFNMYYKAEVEKMIAPLEHRILLLEEQIKENK